MAVIPNTNSSVQAAITSATNNAAKGATDNNTLAGNFQTFLTLLTTQLKNQNPLDPLDTNQFTQQLVQFAQVEQQIKQNSQLETLIAINKAAETTTALAYVGTTVAIDGKTAALKNQQATWTFNVPKPVSTTVTIKNATGQTVYTGNFSMNAGHVDLRVGRPRRQRRAVAGRQLHHLGHGQGRQRPDRRDPERDPGRGRFGRRHQDSA